MTVLGVTRQYDKRGLLPDSRDELHKQYRSGESYTGEGLVEYVKHLDAFRERCEIKYPLVLGTADDMRNYHVSGIPTVFVVDKQGVIQFVAIGGAKEALITAVVDRLLEEQD